MSVDFENLWIGRILSVGPETPHPRDVLESHLHNAEMTINDRESLERVKAYHEAKKHELALAEIGLI